MTLKFLVLDSYDEQGQRFLEANGVAFAGELYRRMLHSLIPHARIDIMYPSLADVPLPSATTLSSYHAIFVTGANLTAYEDTPLIHKQKQLMNDLLLGAVPCFGTCFGLQLAMVVAGGVVQKNPRGRELGIARKIMLTKEGQAHAYFHHKPLAFDAFTSHQDEVFTPAKNAEVLAGNAHTRVQAAVIHGARMRFFGLQYHPEYDLPTICGLIRGRRDDLIKNGSVDNEAEALHYADRLLALHKNPTNQALRFRHAIDDDVLDDTVQKCEVLNWLRCEVL